MTTCEACCREFKASRINKTCPYCGFNNNEHSPWPRTLTSLIRMERERREQKEAKEERAEYLDQEDE